MSTIWRNHVRRYVLRFTDPLTLSLVSVQVAEHDGCYRMVKEKRRHVAAVQIVAKNRAP